MWTLPILVYCVLPRTSLLSGGSMRHSLLEAPRTDVPVACCADEHIIAYMDRPWVRVRDAHDDPSQTCFQDVNGTTWCALDRELCTDVSSEDSY